MCFEYLRQLSTDSTSEGPQYYTFTRRWPPTSSSKLGFIAQYSLSRMRVGVSVVRLGVCSARSLQSRPISAGENRVSSASGSLRPVIVCCCWESGIRRFTDLSDLMQWVKVRKCGSRSHIDQLVKFRISVCVSYTSRPSVVGTQLDKLSNAVSQFPPHRAVRRHGFHPEHPRGRRSSRSQASTHKGLQVQEGCSR